MRLIMNAYFSSQFSYCPLTWMFHNRSLNHKINRSHERCLRVIYNDGHSSYDELLNLDNSVSIHHKNLQILAIETFRVYTGSVMQGIHWVTYVLSLLNHLQITT